jgi:acid stress-induced BolA-like protein IbaG/YrbA
MTLNILNAPDPAQIAQQIHEAISAALPGAAIEVTPTSPGHFEIVVTSEVFAGKPLVRQQQLVYAAIAPLMTGDAPAVHAIDRLKTQT